MIFWCDVFPLRRIRFAAQGLLGKTRHVLTVCKPSTWHEEKSNFLVYLLPSLWIELAHWQHRVSGNFDTWHYIGFVCQKMADGEGEGPKIVCFSDVRKIWGAQYWRRHWTRIILFSAILLPVEMNSSVKTCGIHEVKRRRWIIIFQGQCLF